MLDIVPLITLENFENSVYHPMKIKAFSTYDNNLQRETRVGVVFRFNTGRTEHQVLIHTERQEPEISPW